jgi:hypothetical protein
VSSRELDRRSLRPIRAVSTVGVSALRRTRTTTTLRWSADAVTGEMTRPGREATPVRVPFAAQPPWFGVNEPLAALPLVEGYEARFQLLVAGPWRVRPMRLAVTGTETVTCAAGTFEAFAVEITPLDGNPAGARTIKVRQAAPHYVLTEERAGRISSRFELVAIQD